MPSAPELHPDQPAGQCYRCGYDLRGIANDRPCPECGLLAERSRRLTDELHDTRPRWLRSISLGVWLILLALLLTAAWPFILARIEHWWGYVPWVYQLEKVGFCAAALLFIVGITLLTRRERYAPADQQDAWRRRLLRMIAALPLLALLLISIGDVASLLGYATFGWDYRDLIEGAGRAAFLLALLCIPLPLLLFYHLRSLARRARSAHVAEHCAIVGIGASAAILYICAVTIVLPAVDRHMDDPFWLARSSLALAIALLGAVAAGLFLLWALYLMIRFAIAFHRAARQLRGKWRRDDLAIR